MFRLILQWGSLVLVFPLFSCGTEELVQDLPVDATPAWGTSWGNRNAGRELALKTCTACHVVEGKGNALKGAPPFAQTVQRDNIDAEWLRRWIKDPLLQKPGTLMPNLGLSDSQVEHLIAYLYGMREEN